MSPSHGPTACVVRCILLALLVVLLPSLSACRPGGLAVAGAATATPGVGTPAPTIATGTDQVVPLTVALGPGGTVLAFVPVTINGQGPYAFALDTGASQSIVDKSIAQQLGLPTVGSAGQVTGVTGAERADLVAVAMWSVGDVSLPGTQLVSLDLPAPSKGVGLAGLLGSDILSRFGAITVDYQRQLLILHVLD